MAFCSQVSEPVFRLELTEAEAKYLRGHLQNYNPFIGELNYKRTHTR